MKNNREDTVHWIRESVKWKNKSVSSGRKVLFEKIFRYFISTKMSGLSSDPAMEGSACLS